MVRALKKAYKLLIVSLFCSITGFLKFFLISRSLIGVLGSYLSISISKSAEERKHFCNSRRASVRAQLVALVHNAIPTIELICAVAFVAMAPSLMSLGIAVASCLAVCTVLHLMNIRICSDVYYSEADDKLIVNEYEYTRPLKQQTFLSILKMYITWDDYKVKNYHSLHFSCFSYAVMSVLAVLLKVRDFILAPVRELDEESCCCRPSDSMTRVQGSCCKSDDAAQGKLDQVTYHGIKESKDEEVSNTASMSREDQYVISDPQHMSDLQCSQACGHQCHSM